MRFAITKQRLKLIIALLGCALAILLVTFAPDNDVFAADNELAAVYRNGQLEVNIPYDAALARSGSVNVEIIDPNDKPVAKAPRPLTGSNQSTPWRTAIPFEKKVALEDLAWDRLKITAGDESRIVSLSEILRVPVVRIFAQRSYAAGSSASARIIT